MLELVREDDVERGAARLERAVHVHHLGLVAERPHGAEVGVVAGVVAADAATEIRLQHDDARIAIDAGDGGRAEDGRDRRPRRRLELVGGCLHGGRVGVQRIVLVEVRVCALRE